MKTSKTVNGVETKHIWDGSNIVADVVSSVDSSGASVVDTTKYVRGLGIIFSNTNNSKIFYHHNAHGDVTNLTNATGGAVKSYNYDAFGVETNPVSTDVNPFRYCGEYFDNETGSIYLRARYYNPNMGRFITEDPIRDGNNWYAYANNNPVNFTDRTGLYAESDNNLPQWAWDLINGTGSYTEQWNTAYAAGNQAGMDAAHTGAESVRSRAKAVGIALYYAERTSYDNGFHYYDSNANSSDGSDCTNYISICLNGAGIAMTDDWYWNSYAERDSGLRGMLGKSATDASASWLCPDEFYRYFTSGGHSDGVAFMAKGTDLSTVPGGILPGDVIAFNNFDEVPQGYINHLGIVTSIQSGGMHFSGHTNSRNNESLNTVLSGFNGDLYIIRIRY